MDDQCTCSELSREAGVYCHVCLQILELELGTIAKNVRIAQLCNPQWFADQEMALYY